MLILIPTNTAATAGKDIINDNFSEVENRLQGVEVNTYIRSGNGAPSNSLGNNNDYYINNNNQNLHRKVNGSWQFVTNMKGDTGRGFLPRGEWNPASIQYNVDDLVLYSGAIYRVKFNHTSSAASPPNGSNNYEEWSKGLVYKGEWSSAITYYPNDVVTRFGSTYVATAEITGGAQPVTNANWKLLAGGYNFAGTWASDGLYVANQLVQYNGSLYRLNATKQTTNTTLPPDSAIYELWARGLQFRGAWVSSATYYVSDVVTYEGNTFICTANGVTGTTVPPNRAEFSLLVHGLFHRGVWSSDGVQYRINNTVTYNGSLYRVTQTVTSAAASPPDTHASYQLLASKGDKGDKGDTGDTGAPGAISETQQQGIALPIRSSLDFRDVFALTDDSANNKTQITTLPRLGGGLGELYVGNLQAITGSGIYRMNRADVANSNYPAQIGGEHSWIYIELVEQSSNFAMLRVTDLNGINTYYNFKKNGTWSGWQRRSKLKGIFSAYKTNDQALAVNTVVQVWWQASLFNEGSALDVATNRVLIPADLAGYWLFQTELQATGWDAAVSNGGTFAIHLRKNGVNQDTEYTHTSGTSRNQTSRQIGRLWCNAGDAITVHARLTSQQTTDLTIKSGLESSSFEGHFLGV